MGTQERSFTIPEVGSTREDGADNIDTTVSIVANQSPGSLQVDSTVTVSAPDRDAVIEAGGPVTGALNTIGDVVTLNIRNVTFTFRLSPDVGTIRQFRSNLIDEMESELGIQRRIIVNQFQGRLDSLVNTIRDLSGTSESFNIDYAGIDFGETVEQTASMSFDIPVVSVPVPTPDIVQRAWDDIENPTFDVITQWDTGLVRRASTTLEQIEGVEPFRLERELFLETTEFNVDCSVAYPDISGNADSLRQDASSKLEDARAAASDLEQAVNQLGASVSIEGSGASPTRRDALNLISDGGDPVPGLSQSDIFDMDPGEVSSARRAIESVDAENLPGPSFDSLTETLSSLQSQVDNQVELSDCETQFEQTISRANDAIIEGKRIQDEMISIKDRALDLISQTSGGDCSDQFPSLDNDISSFEDDIQDIDIQSLRQQSLTPSDLRENLPEPVSSLRDRMASLRSRVSNQAGGTPCGDEFQSRLDDVQSRINTLSGLETVDGDCTNRFPDLDDEISDVESAAETTVGTIESAFRQRIQQGESREEVVDALTTDDGGIIPRLARGSNSPQEQLDRIEQLKDRVREDTSGQVRRRDVPELPGGAPVAPGEPVETEGSPQCRENFINRLETVEESLNSALNFEFDVRGRVPTDCAEVVSQSLKNDVSTFEVDASGVGENSPRQRISGVISDGERIIDRINRARIPQECKDQLTSRVRRELSGLRTTREQARVQVNCTEEFSGIDSDIESFQNDVAFLSGPSQQQISNLTNRGEQLIERVERTVDEQNCQREFTNRIREAVSTLQERQQRVTVSPGEGLERIEERQKRIEDLQGRTQELIQQIAETPVQDRLEDELPET